MLASDFYKTFVNKSVNDNLYWTYTQQFKIIEYGGPGVLTIYMRKPEILIYRTWAIAYIFLACSRLQDSVAQRSWMAKHVGTGERAHFLRSTASYFRFIFA